MAAAVFFVFVSLALLAADLIGHAQSWRRRAREAGDERSRKAREAEKEWWRQAREAAEERKRRARATAASERSKQQATDEARAARRDSETRQQLERIRAEVRCALDVLHAQAEAVEQERLNQLRTEVREALAALIRKRTEQVEAARREAVEVARIAKEAAAAAGRAAWEATGVRDPADWIAAGFNPAEARAWMALDRPQVASGWRSSGFTDTATAAWLQDNFRLEEALEWRSAFWSTDLSLVAGEDDHYAARCARNWRLGGQSAPDAEQWGFLPYFVALRFMAQGLEFEDVILELQLESVLPELAGSQLTEAIASQMQRMGASRAMIEEMVDRRPEVDRRPQPPESQQGPAIEVCSACGHGIDDVTATCGCV